MATKKQNKENTEKQKNQLQEMTELAQRSQASFDNYRKQTEKRIKDMQQLATKDIISQLLPIIDNFELALKNTVNIDKSNDFVQGIELIHQQLSKLLEDNGIKAIKTKNQKFDPYTHEALMKVKADLPENSVIEELQKGYTLHDQVIRHAKVKISAGKAQEDN